MKKTNFYLKPMLSFLLVLLIGNTAFGQLGNAVNITSIASAKNVFVLTVAGDVAKERTEKVITSDFDITAEDYDISKLATYAQWKFKEITVSSNTADGTPTTVTYYEIYDRYYTKVLRWSEKESKLIMIPIADFNEIHKKKEGTFEYVQPFKIRMTNWFQLKPDGDYVRIYRCAPNGNSYQIGGKWMNPLKLILVDR